MNNIYLTGIMGSGKTAIGRLLATETCLSFFDIDEWIEDGAGISITELFERYGEEHFRELESEALHNISMKDSVIASCGGGIVLRGENLALMKRTGKIVYIERDIDEIMASVDTQSRPLLDADANNLKQIFAQRKDIYEQTCDLRVKNENKPEDAAQKIRAFMGI